MSVLSLYNRTTFWYNLQYDCKGGVTLSAEEKIIKLFTHQSVLETRQMTQAGISRVQIAKCLNSGLLCRCGRGLYRTSDTPEDELFNLQQRYRRGILSHETALHLLGYSDRIPYKVHMTFPRGYHANFEEDVEAVSVIPENYDLGITTIQSSYSNPLRVYNLERTLCDMLRGSLPDVQRVVPAMQQYAASKDKNIQRLLQYAEQLCVLPKVSRYLEALL